MTTTHEPPTPALPAPLIEGSFAIYTTPDGGLVLVWRKRGDSVDHPMPIPRHLIALGSQMSGMTQADLIAKIQSGDLT